MSNRWIRLDVDYFGNVKSLLAGLDGRALHLASICWSAKHLTDGLVPAEVVPILLREAGVKRSALDKLVAVGLWVPVEHDYVIHDYLAHNDSRAKVERERVLYRKRQERWKRRSDASDDAS